MDLEDMIEELECWYELNVEGASEDETHLTFSKINNVNSLTFIATEKDK